MALIKCHECAKEISSKASTCPFCGAKPPPSKIKTWGLVFIIAFFTVAGVAGHKPTPPAAPADPAADARMETVVGYASLLKRELRDPSSLEWIDVLANDDASVICFSYRARNGFGGMNVENISIVKGKLWKSNDSWNKHCAGKTLHDLKPSVRFLVK